MSDINAVILIGRLTRDAELKYTASGIPVCKFSIAVNRNVKRGDKWEDEASFFDVTLFGKQGEALNQYLVKGKQIGVTGELRQERWTDKGSGQTRSKVEVVANNIQLLSGGGTGESGQSSESSNRTSTNRQNQSSQRKDDDDGFVDDIPF